MHASATARSAHATSSNSDQSTESPPDLMDRGGLCYLLIAASLYNEAMQRAGSLFLVTWLAVSLLIPAWLSQYTTQLPACCRRAGNHHCGMLMPAAGAQNSPHSAISSHCPFRNARPADAVLPFSSLPAPAQVSFGELLSHPTVKPQTEARFRVSFLRSCQKRGPPSLLA